MNVGYLNTSFREAFGEEYDMSMSFQRTQTISSNSLKLANNQASKARFLVRRGCWNIQVQVERFPVKIVLQCSISKRALKIEEDHIALWGNLEHCICIGKLSQA